MSILEQKELRLPGITLTLYKGDKKVSAHHPSGFHVELILRGHPDVNPSYSMTQDEIFEKLVRMLVAGVRVYAVDDINRDLLNVMREDNERLTKELAELKQKYESAAEEQGHVDSAT